jgi:glycosyltransferase involved in cell wall biosynthesis
MSTRVSIIVPTYNHGQYIGQCLESVLAQTFRDWELVVIDDHSSDSTPAIVERYARRDERVCLFTHKVNYGIRQLSRTYNEGLGATQGELVAVLEGDDFWPPHRLELQVTSMTAPDVVLSHGLFQIVSTEPARGDFQSAVPYPFRTDVRTNTPTGSALKALFLGSNPLRAQTVMLRRKILDAIGGYQQPSYWCLTDYPTWMCIAALGKFVFVDEILGYWRRHAASVTSSQKVEMLHGFLRYVEEVADERGAELIRLLPSLAPYVRRRGLATLAYLFRHYFHEKKWRRAMSFLLRLVEKDEILQSLRGIYDVGEYLRLKMAEWRIA